MEQRTNYAIFVDLENTGGKDITLQSVIEKVKIRGNIIQGNVYGYKEAFSGLTETLLSNTFNVTPSITFGANKKNNLDIKLVIDALEVAYTNSFINCFCIVSGDSDYTPLVGKLRSMGKYVLGISRSEVTSKIFKNACDEFIFLETVTKIKKSKEDDKGLKALSDKVKNIIIDQGEEDGSIYVSKVKSTLLRLYSDFSEKDYGFDSFTKLMNLLGSKFNEFKVYYDQRALKIRLTEEIKTDKAFDWRKEIIQILDEFYEEGFSRINPSILKSRLQSVNKDFDETSLGFKKFGDLLYQLEKEKVLKLEQDDNKTMLIELIK